MSNNIPAIIVEGDAEKAIIDVLLDHDKLNFNRNELLFEKVNKIRSSKNFIDKYLSHNIGDSKITLYRIIDSKNENFKIKPPYNNKINKIINIYTCPEIEILFIIFYGKYDEYTNKYKSKMKPSQYLKNNFNELKNYKNYQEVYDFWDLRIDDLVKVLIEYKKLSNNKDNYCIFHILKSGNIV